MRPGDYIHSLFKPPDRVSLVAISRAGRGDRVVQRVYSAEIVATDRTQAWLRHPNTSRHDLFLGVNPVRPGAWGRTKAAIGDVMRVYLEIEEDGERAPAHPVRFAGRAAPGAHARGALLAGPLPCPVERAVGALRYGADTQVIDVARVLRIPG